MQGIGYADILALLALLVHGVLRITRREREIRFLLRQQKRNRAIERMLRRRTHAVRNFVTYTLGVMHETWEASRPGEPFPEPGEHMMDALDFTMDSVEVGD